MNARETSPRLGRGLAALLGEATMNADSAATTRALAVDMLEPSPFQPRGDMNPEALAELAASIKASGVLQPLLVRAHPEVPGRYQIIAGERRWRAAQAAGLHEVPALVRVLNDTEAMAAALVENLQRQDLNAMEEAAGYERLVEEFGLTQEALAGAVGKSRSHVGNTMRLLALPAPVRNMVANGTLTAGHARALLTHPDPEQAAIVVLARDMSVRETEAFVARPQAPARARGTGATGRSNPDIADLERRLSEHLGLRVEVSARGQAGTMRIHFRTLDQLDALITKLS
ncbi:MAG: ParB/RepB/Spo0J family partition protein [Rhodospirillales bacterium]|nr:ParB/RepB/Spo0J family partition protein [Rhodospirillales bacterium]